MGTVDSIGFAPNSRALIFPPQSVDVGRMVMVTFHYCADRWLPGKIVRQDTAEPHRTLIALDDGPILLGTECQYRIVRDESNPY